mgnify:FL=1
MIEFQCTVQEGYVPSTLRNELANTIESCCLEILGISQGPVNVSWVSVPKGFGFRGGHPSTTSLVRGKIPDGCDKDTRSKLMRCIGDEWCRITGTKQDELIVSARDMSWAG